MKSIKISENFSFWGRPLRAMQSALKVPLQKERHFCLDAARASLLVNGLAARQKEAI